MATKKEIIEHFKIALKEVGKIKPWFDKNVNCWVFLHENYPVEYGGDSPEEVIEYYPKYLEEFIKHRLDNKLSPINEKETKGKGGYRQGAGRPKRSKSSIPTKQIRVPVDIAEWLKYPETITHLRLLMESYTRVTTAR